MYWVDNGTGVTTPPTIPPVQSSVRQYFTEGGQGQQPTIPGGEWFNMVTDELIALLSAAGLQPDKLDHAQLKKALDKLFLGRKDPGAEIKQDGSANTFFENVGLKSAAKRDVGAGALQIPDMTFFNSTPGSVYRFPNGLWVQLCSYTSTGTGDKLVRTPVPFPKRILFITPAYMSAVLPSANNYSSFNFSVKSEDTFIYRNFNVLGSEIGAGYTVNFLVWGE